MLYELATGSSRSEIVCLNPCSNGICSTRVYLWKSKQLSEMVLILVLMEYALRAPRAESGARRRARCLNPCSNGICSTRQIIQVTTIKTIRRSLNPCSNGICSTSSCAYLYAQCCTSLNPCSNGICSTSLG